MPRLKVCSVDYLNSAPLVWGMLYGPQEGIFDLTFRLPSECAEMLKTGEADVGNIPVIECARQVLEIVRGTGVASHGAVRSILLASTRPLDQIRTLSADASSRTSVVLAQIVLARRYGIEPQVFSAPPDLNAMLRQADAALIIGDPALRLEPSKLPYLITDLGSEWFSMTGLPMVFAVWAAPSGRVTPEASEVFRDSCRYGRARIDEVIDHESPARGISPELARAYLTRHIVNELCPRDYEGMELYLRYARDARLL